MSFEKWWPRIVLIAGAIGRLIAFYIGVRILLGQEQIVMHDSKRNADVMLLIVAFVLMGVPGAGLLERGLSLGEAFLAFLRLPPERRGPEKPSAGSSDASHE